MDRQFGSSRLPLFSMVITSFGFSRRVLEVAALLLVAGAAEDQREPVAGVAADTPELAERACELIEVEYEELPLIRTTLLPPGVPCTRPR